MPLTSERLPPPKSKIGKVLFMLLTRNEIKERDTNLTSFRSIISDLRHDYGIPVQYKDKIDTDEFGHRSVYRVRYLWQISRKRAIRVYLRMTAS